MILLIKIYEIYIKNILYYNKIIDLLKWSFNSFSYNFFNHCWVNKIAVNIFQSINSSKNLIKIIITLYLASSAEILSWDGFPFDEKLDNSGNSFSLSYSFQSFILLLQI